MAASRRAASELDSVPGPNGESAARSSSFGAQRGFYLGSIILVFVKKIIQKPLNLLLADNARIGAGAASITVV